MNVLLVLILAASGVYVRTNVIVNLKNLYFVYNNYATFIIVF